MEKKIPPRDPNQAARAVIDRIIKKSEATATGKPVKKKKISK